MTGQKRKVLAVIGSAVFLLIAPATVAALVPWWISRWHIAPSFESFLIVRIFGTLMLLAGISMLLDSFARFALHGIGTPAPVFPTRHLVIEGLYRHVRNPMYLALLFMVTGQAMLFLSLPLFEYAAIVWSVSHMFVVAYEEHTLQSKYGDQYERYRANVPRWIPRLRAWDDSARTECR